MNDMQNWHVIILKVKQSNVRKSFVANQNGYS